jgi:hypothetical protein
MYVFTVGESKMKTYTYLTVIGNNVTKQQLGVCC